MSNELWVASGELKAQMLKANKSENMEKNYIAPVVEVIEVEVEQGFALSNGIGINGTPGTPAAPGSRGGWDDLDW